jgi:hypothetical protein
MGENLPNRKPADPIRELRVSDLLVECGAQIENMIRTAGRSGVIGGSS